jgi:hypothetical protein
MERLERHGASALRAHAKTPRTFTKSAMADLPSGGRRRPSGELQLSTIAMVSLVVSSECDYRSAWPTDTSRRSKAMGLIILLLVLLLLFGGGGFYYGPPYHYYGGGLGLVLLIVVIVLLFRRRA